MQRRIPRLAHAEDRVRGHRPGGHDRGDEGHPVGRRGDFAIAETRPIDARAIPEQPARGRRIDELRRAAGVDRERVEQLPLQDGQARAPEVRAIVGRVQLAAEAGAPALFAAERRRDGEHARQDLAIADVGQFGDGEPVAAEPAHQRQRQPHGPGHRPLVRHIVEHRGRPHTRPRLQIRRDARGGGGDETEADAAMNRKQAVAVVEPDGGIDGAA